MCLVVLHCGIGAIERGVTLGTCKYTPTVWILSLLEKLPSENSFDVKGQANYYGMNKLVHNKNDNWNRKHLREQVQSHRLLHVTRHTQLDTPEAQKLYSGTRGEQSFE